MDFIQPSEVKDGSFELHCPFPGCGHEYVTVVAACVVDTRDDYRPKSSARLDLRSVQWYFGDPDGVHSITENEPTGNRGHAYALEADCENGHRFRLVFERHKGYTFVRTQLLASD